MYFGKNLLKWAQIYAQMAEEQLSLPFPPETMAPIDTPEMKVYKQFFKDIPTLSWSDIEELIVEDFDGKPYYNEDELAKLLVEKAFKEVKNLTSVNDTLRDVSVKHTFFDKMKLLAIEYFLDHITDTYLTAKEYVNIIEKTTNLPDKYLRKAQARILKEISNLGTDNPTEDSYRVSQKELAHLMTASTKFSQDLLWRVAKHFGPEYYGEIVEKMGNRPPSEYNNKVWLPSIKDKDIYNVYDLSIVLQELRHYDKRSFDAPDFQKLIKKCNPEAKQYLRRLLYGHNTSRTTSEYFILDEEMKPMNEEMKNIPFPSYFWILWGWQEIDPIRELWLPIFHDFGIIPVEIV